MAIDGTYGFVYCGVNGLGVGVFTVLNGKFVGSDYAGGRYRGTAQETSAGISLKIVWEVPAGMGTVQGMSPQDAPHSRDISVELPPDFGDGAPQDLTSLPGMIKVMIKRIPDDFAPAATNGFTLQIAQKLATVTT